MYEGSDNHTRADEVVAAVRAVVDQRDELTSRLDDAEYALHLMRQERDELRRELEEIHGDELKVFSMDVPGDRSWAFHEDCGVLALSRDIDQDTRERLIAQSLPPKLAACPVCGAPMYAGTACGMHTEA